MTEWATNHYKRWLSRDAQRVIRIAKLMLEEIRDDGYEVIEARRTLLVTEYVPCSHTKKGGHY